MIYNRKTKEYFDEADYCSKTSEFLYNNTLGRLLLKVAVRPVSSRLYGFYTKTPISRPQIRRYVNKYVIQADDTHYFCYNDFFTRKKNYTVNRDPYALISPCNGKILLYPIEKGRRLTIKQSEYSLYELLKEEMKYSWDTCAVIRLSIRDIHRYCFIDDGTVEARNSISGQLHVVKSISDDYPIYKENKREWTILDTRHFGKVLQMEVGAMCIGDIVNPPFSKLLTFFENVPSCEIS